MTRLIPFRLQYASNLFVDFQKQPFQSFLRPASGNLALLGNIGRPEHPKTYHFLKYCSKNWNNIFWIPGPHELTNPQGGRATYQEKTASAINLCNQFQNVRFLNSQEAVFRSSNVVLLGSPLWTSLKLQPKGQPEFDSIYSSVDEAGPIPLTNKERNSWNAMDKLFLNERSLFWSIVYPEVNLVYLTHTLPTTRLLTPPLTENAMNRLSLDAESPKVLQPIRAWLGGSTGSTQCINVGSDPSSQIKMGVNSLYEYPFDLHQELKKEYNPECVLELEPHVPRGNSPLFLPHLILPPLLSSLLQRKTSLGYA